MSTSLLVAAVAWGGVACACGTASFAAEPASPHAAHHGDGGEPGYVDCERIDCAGDCTSDGLPPERAPAPPEAPAVSLDDGTATPAFPLPAELTPLGPRGHSPPVPEHWRAADTPVRRFDVLLN